MCLSKVLVDMVNTPFSGVDFNETVMPPQQAVRLHEILKRFQDSLEYTSASTLAFHCGRPRVVTDLSWLYSDVRAFMLRWSITFANGSMSYVNLLNMQGAASPDAMQSVRALHVGDSP